MLLRSLLAVCVLLIAQTLNAATANWSVIHRFALGGEGGWDYMTFDPSNGRLFITRGDHVMVMGIDGKLLGDIPGMHRAHGIALVPALNRGFVSNGQSGTVTEFDTQTFKPLREISVSAENPDAILYDDATQRVVTFNGGSKTASAINPVTGKVVVTSTLPGRPEFAATDGEGHLFVNIEDVGKLAKLAANDLKVEQTWALAGCDSPSGLALDKTHHRLFSVCANRQMVILDSRDGHFVATVPIGDGPDAAAYDPDIATVFSSNSDGTLTVIHQDDADHYRVVANAATPSRSRTLALDPTGHQIYLASAEFGETPAKTDAQPHPRPAMRPDSFAIVVVARP